MTEGRSIFSRLFLVLLALLVVPHLVLMGVLLYIGNQGYEGVCRLHLEAPEPCGRMEYLFNDVIANPFMFTLGAMGSGAWCALCALVGLIAGVVWLIRSRRRDTD